MKLEYSDVKKTAGKLKFRTKAFIDGKFVNAASGKTYVSVNPATGQPLTNIASCDGADVDLAVKTARRSFDQGVWSKRSPAERKHVLLKLADLLEVSKEWIVGDPLDPATKVGPMIEESHMNTVLDYIESGKSEGAKLALGGGRTLQKTGGFFVEPTIFDQVKPSMRIAREEIFGPVLSVFTFDKEEDGIALANDTSYGLTASVYTQDVSRAHRAALVMGMAIATMRTKKSRP